MKPKWIIENYEHDSSLTPLIEEIKKQGMDLEIIKYKPWESGTFNQYHNTDCVIFYGTLNLGRQLQKQKGWIPGVYCNFQNLCCVSYFSYWGEYLFNSDYIMLPMMEVLRRQDYVYNMFGIEDVIFIRPNSGAKPFTGQTLPKETIEKEFKLFSNYAGKPLDEIIVVISSPKVIDKEWRCVIIDKKVVAYSQYKKNDKLDIENSIDSEALCLAGKIAKEEWQPDKIYTLDICKSGDKYALLEINSFSCSGLYEADPKPIVKEISRAAVEEWKDFYEIEI